MDIWQFLAGVTLFIMGMQFLEEALQGLAGRPFKLFLRRNSSHPLKAIASGTAVTMLLQSSSIVNLLVLAFVGTGLIGMKNGLAIILGANLGTTATSWLIAVAGFGFNIESAALPVVGIAGIIYYLFKRESTAGRWWLLLLGLGLLFTGLGFIKTGMIGVVEQVNLQRFAGANPLLFLGVGLALTTLIQASSATMAITLSVLATQAISLQDAMAVALGSEVGTTMKIVLAAAGGSPDKKRVALGNFLFNVISTVIFMCLLNPVAHLIKDIWMVRENIIALVVFQTLVNLAGILLFLPFLNRLARWLESSFGDNSPKAIFLDEVRAADPGLALQAGQKEVSSLIQHVVVFCRLVFQIAPAANQQPYVHRNFIALPLKESYAFIKMQHGEIFNFFIRLQSSPLKAEETLKSEKLMTAAREAMYAAKSINDSIADVLEFSASAKDLKFGMFEESRRQVAEFTLALENLLLEPSENKANDLRTFYLHIQGHYKSNIQQMYSDVVHQSLSQLEMSSVINLNRELITAIKSLTLAVKDVLLAPQEADGFDEMPGYSR